MVAPTSFSQLVNLYTSETPRQNTLFGLLKDVNNNDGGGSQGGYRWTSSWQFDGFNKGAGSVPTSVAAPTSATAGALPYIDAGAGTNYLMKVALWGSSDTTPSMNAYMFYDRLVHISGLSGTVTTAQTVGGTITRYTGGEGNVIWLENIADVGTTETTVTASYTNQAGTASRTTVAVPIGGAQTKYDYECIHLPLQDGDTGVRSVQSITLAASTGTAGDIAVVLAHPLSHTVISYAESSSSYPVPFGDMTYDRIDGIPELEDGACLSWLYYAYGTTETVQIGEMTIVEVT